MEETNQTLQEIEPTLNQELQEVEQVTTKTTHEAYTKYKKEKNHQYYLNKKAKQEAKKLYGDVAEDNTVKSKSTNKYTKKDLKLERFGESGKHLIDEITELQKGQTDIIETTKKSHMNGFKMLINCISSNKEELLHMLRHQQELVIEKIEHSKKQDGIEEYSNASKNRMLQTIAPLLILFNIEYTDNDMTLYRSKMEQYKFEYVSSVIQKKELSSFASYLQNVITMFGERSMQHIVARLYYEIPVRDDFHLKLVKYKVDTKSKEHNYLLLNKTTAQIILNNYKTVKFYKKKTYDLSPELKELLISYLELKENKHEYLFDDVTHLSAFVCKMNQALGYDYGINLFRKMAVTDLYKTDATYEQKVELASKMCHSVNEALLVYSGKTNDDV